MYIFFSAELLTNTQTQKTQPFLGSERKFPFLLTKRCHYDDRSILPDWWTFIRCEIKQG